MRTLSRSWVLIYTATDKTLTWNAPERTKSSSRTEDGHLGSWMRSPAMLGPELSFLPALESRSRRRARTTRSIRTVSWRTRKRIT